MKNYIQLRRIDYYIEIIIFMFMLIVMVLQVLYRFIPGLRVPWTVEIISFLFGALIWFGVSVAIKENTHVGITFLIDLLPIKYKKAIKIIQTFLFGLLMILICVFGIQALLNYFVSYITTPIMKAPYYIVRSPLFFGCILSCYRLIEKIILIARNNEYEN